MTGTFGRFGGWAAVVAGGLMLASPAAAQDKAAGEKTATYLEKVKKIFDADGPADDASAADKVRALRAVVSKVDDLSARGVDAEAVELVERMTGLLGRFADYLDDYGEPEKAFLSGFRDGLKNNPTRALDEMQAIQKEAEAVKAAVGKTRKRLESRYDRDFPTLVK